MPSEQPFPTQPMPSVIRDPGLAAIDGISHAFFTREGGISQGLYASLNAGPGSSDASENVGHNRRIAMGVFGLEAGDLVTAYQVHSAEIAEITGPFGAGGPARVDGMVTATRGIAIGILTADCAPVLLADPEAEIIGAAHAGWRGAIGGILEATINGMERLGARANRITAAIGPCIGQNSYEVGPEFPAPFIAEDSANAAFFRNAARPGHYMFDIEAYVAKRLKDTGIAAVGLSRLDTCAETDRFFSYRRSVLVGAPDYGRNLSAISLMDAGNKGEER